MLWRVVRVPGWSGAQYPQPGVEDLPEFGLGVGGLALVGQRPGDLMAGGQGVGVVGAQHPQLSGEDLPEFGLGSMVAAQEPECRRSTESQLKHRLVVFG
jgi:hypothetical protein